MRLLNLYFVLILILTACTKEEVFDENDNQVEPAQYKALSTFSVERDLFSQ